MAVVVGVLVAMVGWLVNEFFARRAVRRNLRIEYLLSAYRRLEHASNRQMTEKTGSFHLSAATASRARLRADSHLRRLLLAD